VYILLNKDKDLSSRVFTPEKPTNLPNQHSYRLNYLTEFVSQQVNQNLEIKHSINKIVETVNTTHQNQEKKIDQVLQDQHLQKKQSDFFREKVESHGKTSEDILHSLDHIKNYQDQLNESMLNEQLLNQAILDQLNFQDQQLRHTNSQLESYVALAGQLSEQLIIQGQLLKEMEQKLQVQDVYHQTVMSKLDKQDAINDKIIRQLDHLKAIVFERANIIVEKVDSSFQSTSDYFQDVIKKSGFMKPFLLSSRSKNNVKIDFGAETEPEAEENNKII
jgi:hypothetical protein